MQSFFSPAAKQRQAVEHRKGARQCVAFPGAGGYVVKARYITMRAETVLAIFLAFFCVNWAWDIALTLLNLRHARRAAGAVPAAFAGIVDPETHSRSVKYTLAHGRFGLISSGVSSAALLGFILTGFMGFLDTLARGLHVHPYLEGILFMASVSFFFGVIQFPFSIYSTFVLEARFGFNRTTPRLFVLDMLKGLAVSAVIGIPVLVVLFWFMDRTGPFWWIWAFAATTAFQFVMSILAPMVIAPFFNKFTPLPDGTLKTRIFELAARLGFKTRGIFVVDSSKRSRHSNAYFTGLGRAKRIVLFDTLVASHTVEEIVSVLAHEIGHEKRHHITIGLAISTAVSLAGFWILSLLLPWPTLYTAFGFAQPGYPALLVLLAFCARPFVFWLQPLLSLRSRVQEYEADRYAVRGVGSAAGLKSALLRLSRDNLSNLSPHPLYSFFHYSHPTLAERIAALDRAETALVAERSLLSN
jgi:STE24 endopeptidase